MDVFTPMWVYILECCDGTYYIGVSRNLNRRVQAHNHGKGAKYTKKRTPVKLVYFEQYSSHAPAYLREKELKKLTHEGKKRLIETMHRNYGSSKKKSNSIICMVIGISVFTLLFTQPVFAHPGRTASDGCHYCRTNCDKWGEVWNARHCHGGYVAPVVQKTSIPTRIPTRISIRVPTQTPTPTIRPTLAHIPISIKTPIPTTTELGNQTSNTGKIMMTLASIPTGIFGAMYLLTKMRGKI